MVIHGKGNNKLIPLLLLIIVISDLIIDLHAGICMNRQEGVKCTNRMIDLSD